MSLRPLRPEPRLRPLTWAGLSALSPSLGGATIRDLAGDGEVAVTEPAAFVRAACVEGDPGAALALRCLPAGVVAGHVLSALRGAVREANGDAAAYGRTLRARMPEAYRETYAEWAADAGGSARSVESSLAGQDPGAWAVLSDWPLARTLRYFEDAARAAFLRDLDEMTREATT